MTETPQQRRKRHYKKSYGVSLCYVENEIQKRKGVCDICGDKVKLNLDHDHKSGRIRGFLCQRCNTALGLFQDNAATILKAMHYLSHADKQTKPHQDGGEVQSA